TGFSGEMISSSQASRAQNVNAPWRAATVPVTPAQQPQDAKAKPQDFGLDIPEFLRNRRPPK
ncbi:MAG: cell division protein FtsZ, partial [Microcoleus sp. PH2017_03_ELD_O_A]|nr:cell division protein FtsZ [Microcoleus sp. PH2017_03_ELD_O_A]